MGLLVIGGHSFRDKDKTNGAQPLRLIIFLTNFLFILFVLIVFLVMLDLSAAFDTIDHTIFVNRLCHTFHIKGCAQKWFASYLQNRKNRVCISGEFSKEHILNFGLPQGSILGPRGYTMYTHPVGDILRRNNVSFHIYADDTQVYVAFDPRIDGECERSLNKLQICVRQIKSWMSQNKLQLNQEKTEFFIAASS